MLYIIVKSESDVTKRTFYENAIGQNICCIQISPRDFSLVLSISLLCSIL